MARYRHYMNPVTRTRVKRRKKGFLGGLGADAGVMQRGLTASFDAVKAVGVTAIVAASGAIATDYIFNQLKGTLGLTDATQINLAKAVTGIAGGLVIGKFLKKPQLGAAFAIGAVAVAMYNIIKPKLGMTAGLGYVSAEKAGFKPAPLALGATSVNRQQAFRPQMAGYGSY